MIDICPLNSREESTVIYGAIYQCSTPSVNCEPIRDVCCDIERCSHRDVVSAWLDPIRYRNVFFQLSPTRYMINTAAFMCLIPSTGGLNKSFSHWLPTCWPTELPPDIWSLYKYYWINSFHFDNWTPTKYHHPIL